MLRYLCLPILSVVVLFQVSVAAEEAVEATAVPSASTARLTVFDESGKSHSLQSGDFLRLPRRSVKVSTHGVDTEFSGASLVDVLQSCGVTFGKELGGKRTPTVAILEATDG